MKKLMSVTLLMLTGTFAAVAMDVPVATPEISAGNAAGAVGLLTGALLVMRSRRKR